MQAALLADLGGAAPENQAARLEAWVRSVPPPRGSRSWWTGWSDGGATWAVVLEGELPRDPELGPNYAFLHADAWALDDAGVAIWAPLVPDPVDRLRIEVLSGWDAGRWALGEVEAFGIGAVEATDDDWYDVNADVIAEPGTWSYRVVAENAEGRTVGPEQVVTVVAP